MVEILFLKKNKITKTMETYFVGRKAGQPQTAAPETVKICALLCVIILQ